jgi:NADH dehydrogenase
MPSDAPVLVLGGGMAGVACTQVLSKAAVPVTLVDRNDYHQFQPLLYQVASSQLPAVDVARPHRTIFKGHPTVQVLTAAVDSADLAGRTLRLADGRTLSGSHLVIAAGGRPNFFGIPGAAEHAFPLYSVADAERLRLRLQRGLKSRAAAESPPGEPHNVVVIGAGPTGVEITGALSELLNALRQDGRVRGDSAVFLVDRSAVLLAQFSKKAHAYALRKLTDAGAQVRLGAGVTAVRPDGVDLEDGTTLPAVAVVWAGGESAARVADAAGAVCGAGGRIDVRADLRVDDLDGVWAAGDVANIPAGTHGTLPQLGSVAQQSGGWVAENILRERREEPTRPFRYKDKGIMAMIGRNAAVAEVGRHRHQVEGPIAFAAWLGVHAVLLSGVHSKSDAFLTWAWDYFERDHAATLEASAQPERIAWGEEDDDQPHIDLDQTPAAETPAGPQQGGHRG